jgi:transposase
MSNLAIMDIHLSPQAKRELEKRHRIERDARVCDRIKAVLLKSESWTNEAIAQALRIHADTVADHLHAWQTSQQLKPGNGGSSSKLNTQQTRALDAHVQAHCYTKVIDLCHFVYQTYGVSYTVSGMTKWLQQHGFRYKQPKRTPAKADPEQQEAWVKNYLALLDDTPANQPIVFIDAVHPTMATKITCGWIKKGVSKPIAQTASRTRVNVIGAIELKPMRVHSRVVETVNVPTILEFFTQLKAAYPAAPKLHVMLDRAGYHCSHELQQQAAAMGLVLHLLPPYSPNLNPIERLWKVMNEHIRNNVFFQSAHHFKDAITHFFQHTVHSIKPLLQARINDNFQVICPVPSG